VQAHSTFADATRRFSLSIGAALIELHRLDAIAEPMPRLAGFQARRDPGAHGGGHEGRPQRVVFSQGIFVILKPALCKKPYHPSRRSSHHPGYILGRGRREREKRTGGVGRAAIHSIQDKAMKMGIQIESGTETLNRGHRPALSTLYTLVNAGTAPLVGKE
jgi:hypothetical protein